MGQKVISASKSNYFVSGSHFASKKSRRPRKSSYVSALKYHAFLNDETAPLKRALRIQRVVLGSPLESSEKYLQHKTRDDAPQFLLSPKLLSAG